METGKSFSDFMIATEAALGSKPDPDRAYEAFLAGVSAETFARLHGESGKPLDMRSTEKSDPTGVDQVSVSSFAPAPSSESFKLRKPNQGAASEASAYLKASRSFDYTLGAIALTMLASIWLCCGGGLSYFVPAKDAQQQVSRYLEPGRVVVLTRDLPYAVTIEDFKELQKLSSATDNVGVAALVLSGRAGVLEPGTSVKIIESDGWGNRVEVRIASGSEAGKLVQAPLESLEMNVFGPRNP